MSHDAANPRKRGRVAGSFVDVELVRPRESPMTAAMVPQLDQWPGMGAQLSVERRAATPWLQQRQIQPRQQQRATPSAVSPFSRTVEQQVPDVAAFSPRFQPPFDGRRTRTLSSIRHPHPAGPYPAYPCARDDLPRVPFRAPFASQAGRSSAAISTFQLYQANAREVPRSSMAEQFEAIAKEQRSLSGVSSRVSTVSSSATFEDGAMKAKRSKHTSSFHHLPSAPSAPTVPPTVPERPKAVGLPMTGKLFQSFLAPEASLVEPELSFATEGPSVPSLGRDLRDHKVPLGIATVPSVPQDVNEASSDKMSALKHVGRAGREGDRRRERPAAEWPTLFGVKLVPASDVSGKVLLPSVVT